jgi:hypothetical protein
MNGCRYTFICIISKWRAAHILENGSAHCPTNNPFNSVIPKIFRKQKIRPIFKAAV